MMPAERAPLVLFRLCAAILTVVAFQSAHTSVEAYVEFLSDRLPVSEFVAASSACKAALSAVLAALFFVRWRPLVWLIGYQPFHIANFFVIGLLLFVVGAPFALYLNNRPYDLLGDGTVALLYYGYLPVGLFFWITACVSVVRVWHKDADVGKRPVFWLSGLFSALCVWVSRLMSDS